MLKTLEARHLMNKPTLSCMDKVVAIKSSANNANGHAMEDSRRPTQLQEAAVMNNHEHTLQPTSAKKENVSNPHNMGVAVLPLPVARSVGSTDSPPIEESRSITEVDADISEVDVDITGNSARIVSEAQVAGNFTDYCLSVDRTGKTDLQEVAPSNVGSLENEVEATTHKHGQALEISQGRVLRTWA